MSSCCQQIVTARQYGQRTKRSQQSPRSRLSAVVLSNWIDVDNNIHRFLLRQYIRIMQWHSCVAWISAFWSVAVRLPKIVSLFTTANCLETPRNWTLRRPTQPLLNYCHLLKLQMHAAATVWFFTLVYMRLPNSSLKIQGIPYSELFTVNCDINFCLVRNSQQQWIMILLWRKIFYYIY